MSLALNTAIVARVRSENLAAYPVAQAAQTVVNAYAIRYGSTATLPTFPCTTFFEDTGRESLTGDDVGIVQDSVYRFTIWTKDNTGTTILTIADALEKLFDMRRGAPPITLTGDNKCYWCDVFSFLQSPFHDDGINAFFGVIAFRFVEARP
jgi:hypothetical protein